MCRVWVKYVWCEEWQTRVHEDSMFPLDSISYTTVPIAVFALGLLNQVASYERGYVRGY